MQLYKHKTNNFGFSFPDDWTVENNDGIIALFDGNNSIGVLQFSIYYPPQDKEVFLKDLLEEYLTDRHTDFSVKLTDHYAYTDYLPYEDDGIWKYWVFKKDNMVIFGTYN
ncbi:hypothetical protein [Chitinophaga filiformis]|uniref:Uncharacterized protein n=1 Tax=Chitinophaga filiformis TaxID=104663 RepID=A0ABY4HW11_CHIFI|nr:hypothetical protein [Chitinophaga filiformis]UPK67972.1 hypothetical protein MYF79_23755 [Chitinophaga filiformis]